MVLLLSKIEEGIEEDRRKKIPIEEAIAYHEKMLKENIFVIQKGDFSHNSILPILNIIETNLKKDLKESTEKKQIYHILVELLQNVNKHCQTKEGLKEGILTISKTNSHFIVTTGNYIEKNEVEEFKKHLNMLNSLSKDELKELYMKKLLNGTDLNENAGIGLIDISRYINHPLQYSFTETINNNCFFSISVTI